MAGELNKLAFNMAYGRDTAGVHFRNDEKASPSARAPIKSGPAGRAWPCCRSVASTSTATSSR